MRSRALQILLFLALGAIVNVAVAWVCAWQITIDASAIVSTCRPKGLALPGDYRWTLTKSETPGAVRIVATPRIMPGAIQDLELDGFVPVWSNIQDPLRRFCEGLAVPESGQLPGLGQTGAVAIMMSDGRGWPCIGMHCLWNRGYTSRNPPETELLAGGIALPDRSALTRGTLILDERQALPLWPAWPGFAINTLFYALILWLLLLFADILRRHRRVRLGLCPACAYPIGSSPMCTECGRPVTPVESGAVV